MAELDDSQEALRNVEEITDSEPVSGEELVESEDLKRQFREAKPQDTPLIASGHGRD